MPPKPRSLFSRIVAKVELDPNDLNKCWIWKGAFSKKRRNKRPVIQEAGRKSKVISVARYICEVYNGPPPDLNYEAGHTCPDKENEECINPRHLRWITRLENEHFKLTYS